MNYKPKIKSGEVALQIYSAWRLEKLREKFGKDLLVDEKEFKKSMLKEYKENYDIVPGDYSIIKRIKYLFTEAIGYLSFGITIS